MKDAHCIPDDALISIIIPVLHEADIINSAVTELRSGQPGELFEIVIVDGSPARDTLQALGSSDVITLASGAGRGTQMNAGAARAGGAILLFLHADTRLPENALRHIRGALHDTPCVGGAFGLRIRSGKRLFRIIAGAASLRSRLTRIPYGDQAIFVLKDYFVSIGGFREIPILEDMDFMRRIKRRGDDVCILASSVTTSSRRWEREGPVYATVRNRIIAALFFMGVSPQRLARFYRFG